MVGRIPSNDMECDADNSKINWNENKKDYRAFIKNMSIEYVKRYFQ